MHPLAQRADNKPENWRAWIIIGDFAIALFWFILGSNFSCFETKQRKIPLNQRSRSIAVTKKKSAIYV